jgi:uncharacterized protein YjbI with pentapeptide repeats
MRSFLAVAHGVAPEVGAEDPELLVFVPLSGALLTTEGVDLVSTGLGGKPIRTMRPVFAGRTPAVLRRCAAGLRSLLVAALAEPLPADGITVTWLRPLTVIDGWALIRAEGAGVDLSGADLRGADLVRADLRGADLSSADVRGANLTRTDLREAVLENADLRGTSLCRTSMLGARAAGADFRRADLSLADVRGAVFTDAMFRGAELSAMYARLPELRAANLAGVDLDRIDARSSVLDGGPSESGATAGYVRSA